MIQHSRIACSMVHCAASLVSCVASVCDRPAPLERASAGSAIARSPFAVRSSSDSSGRLSPTSRLTSFDASRARATPISDARRPRRRCCHSMIESASSRCSRRSKGGASSRNGSRARRDSSSSPGISATGSLVAPTWRRVVCRSKPSHGTWRIRCSIGTSRARVSELA